MRTSLESWPGFLMSASRGLLGDAPETIETNDPRVQLAARELKKLKPEDLDRLLRLLASMRGMRMAGQAGQAMSAAQENRW